jgi:hypothetical protein
MVKRKAQTGGRVVVEVVVVEVVVVEVDVDEGVVVEVVAVEMVVVVVVEVDVVGFIRLAGVSNVVVSKVPSAVKALLISGVFASELVETSVDSSEIANSWFVETSTTFLIFCGAIVDAGLNVLKMFLSSV